MAGILDELLNDNYGIYSDALSAGLDNFVSEADEVAITQVITSILEDAIEGDQLTATPEEKDLATKRGEFIKSIIAAGHRPNDPKKTFSAAVSSPGLVEEFGVTLNRNSKHPSVGSGRMAYHEGKVGILVINGRHFSNGNLAKVMAQTLYALGLIPDEYRSTLCLLSQNLDPDARATYEKAKASGLLDETGLEVIYDVDGVFEDSKPDIAGGLVWADKDRLCFTMDKEKLTPRMKMVIYDNTISNMQTALRFADSKWTASSFIPWGTTHDSDDEEDYTLSNMIDEISLGMSDVMDKLKADYLDEAKPLPAYGLPQVGGYGGWNIHSAMNSFANLKDEKAIAEIDDIVKIWQGSLNEYGFAFSPRTLHSLHKTEELADRLDIKRRLELYYKHGVPVADILGHSDDKRAR